MRRACVCGAAEACGAGAQVSSLSYTPAPSPHPPPSNTRPRASKPPSPARLSTSACDNRGPMFDRPAFFRGLAGALLLPEATPVGSLSAQLRRIAAQDRLTSTRAIRFFATNVYTREYSLVGRDLASP